MARLRGTISSGVRLIQEVLLTEVYAEVDEVEHLVPEDPLELFLSLFFELALDKALPALEQCEYKNEDTWSICQAHQTA
jgi:hypothetical protein